MREKEGTRQAGLPLPVKVCQRCDQGGTDIYGRPRTACCHRAGSSLKKLLPKSCFQSHLLLPGFKYVSIYVPPPTQSCKIPGPRTKEDHNLMVKSHFSSGPGAYWSTRYRGKRSGVVEETGPRCWRRQGTEINGVPTAHPPCGGTLYTSSQSSLTPLKRHWDPSNWQMQHARLTEPAQGHPAGARLGLVLLDPKHSWSHVNNLNE